MPDPVAQAVASSVMPGSAGLEVLEGDARRRREAAPGRGGDELVEDVQVGRVVDMAHGVHVGRPHRPSGGSAASGGGSSRSMRVGVNGDDAETSVCISAGMRIGWPAVDSSTQSIHAVATVDPSAARTSE